MGMELVKTAQTEAEENKMLCWLYDEDRWPSGSAGGYVTKNIENRARFLVFSPEGYLEDKINDKDFSSSGKAQGGGLRTLLGKYEVTLKDGCLTSRSLTILKKPSVKLTVRAYWSIFPNFSGNFPNQKYRLQDTGTMTT